MDGRFFLLLERQIIDAALIAMLLANEIIVSTVSSAPLQVPFENHQDGSVEDAEASGRTQI